MFKSFSHKLYATKSRNNYRNESKEINELCADCGYPYGAHFGLICPTDPRLKENRDAKQYIATIVPYRPEKKVRKDILKYRAFKKFLYDNDALFEFEKNIKRNAFIPQYRNILSIVRVKKADDYVNCFPWSGVWTILIDGFWADISVNWMKAIRKDPYLKELFHEDII